VSGANSQRLVDSALTHLQQVAERKASGRPPGATTPRASSRVAGLPRLERLPIGVTVPVLFSASSLTGQDRYARHRQDLLGVTLQPWEVTASATRIAFAMTWTTKAPSQMSAERDGCSPSFAATSKTASSGSSLDGRSIRARGTAIHRYVPRRSYALGHVRT